jgi:hypothetical protein
MYLFLLCPACAGSTLLHHLILTSNNVAGLPAAGQGMRGFVGTLPCQYDAGHLFAEIKSQLQDESTYDWNSNKKMWDNAWSNPSIQSGVWANLLQSKTGNETIFLQKSPPDIYRVNMISKFFNPINFIIMTRNPYALSANLKITRSDTAIERIANNIGDYLSSQMQIKESLQNSCLSISYEQLCDNTEETCQKIIDFMPDIHTINFSANFQIERNIVYPTPEQNNIIYDLPITNLNDQEINKSLNSDDINTISSVLNNYQDAMNYWNYTIL